MNVREPYYSLFFEVNSVYGIDRFLKAFVYVIYNLEALLSLKNEKFLRADWCGGK